MLLIRVYDIAVAIDNWAYNLGFFDTCIREQSLFPICHGISKVERLWGLQLRK